MAPTVPLHTLSPSFYDKNPVGRLITRVVTDVDVLNELFSAGIVSIFGDIFTLAGIVIAIMIKLDSAGPVFFLQHRYGFNQKPFRIIKFRTMRTLEDDAFITQAKRGDHQRNRAALAQRLEGQVVDDDQEPAEGDRADRRSNEQRPP